MTFGKQIVVLALICMGVWFFLSYEQEIQDQIDGVDTQKVRHAAVFAQAQKHYFAAEYEKAVAKYEQALDEGLEESKTQTAYYHMARCLVHLRKIDQAIAAFEKAIALNPESTVGRSAARELEKLQLETGR